MTSSDVVPVALVVGVMLAVLYGLYRAVTSPFRNRGKISADGAFICPNCGTRGAPKMRAKGSIGVEIIAWLLFLLPGIIYSLWRLSTKELVCPSCGQPGMIGVSTPKGQQLAAQAPPHAAKLQ